MGKLSTYIILYARNRIVSLKSSGMFGSSTKAVTVNGLNV